MFGIIVWFGWHGNNHAPSRKGDGGCNRLSVFGNMFQNFER